MKKQLFVLIVFVLSIITIDVKAEIKETDTVKIGDTGYSNLTAALKKVKNDTPTTITVLKNFEDNITIGEKQDVVLELDGHTISNKADKQLINNKGKLEIKNGTITSDAGSGMIDVASSGKLTVIGATLKATGKRQAIYNNGGTVEISGNSEIESATDERATIRNLNNGTITIVDGTVIAKASYAIYNEKGTLNIGVKDDVYNKVTPQIQGKTYGIIANSKFNIYDGTITGEKCHVGTATTSNTPKTADDKDLTKVNEIEEDSVKETNEENTYLTYNLNSVNRIKIIFEPNGGTISKNYKWMYIGNPIGTLPEPEKQDHEFDGWFTSSTGGDRIDETTEPDQATTYYAHWTYVDPNSVASVEGKEGTMSLKDAIATGGKITLLKNVIITENLFMNKEATLDLNGHTITLKGKSFSVTEKVTINDSSDNQTGRITSDADYTIVVGKNDESTNGDLTLKGGTLENYGIGGVVYSYENLVIDGATLKATASSDNGYTVIIRKTLTMNSGTVYSSNQRAIQVATNATFTMNGGLVKTDAGEQAVNLYGDCSAVINGGTIEGLSTNGAGIAMFGNTELTVNGGTIKGYDMAIAGNGRVDSANANITINGGNMVATDGVGIYLPQRTSTTIINGGNISGPTGIEIRAGNLIVNDGYIIGTSPTYEAEKNDNGTTTKGAAIAVAQHNTQQPINVTVKGSTLRAVVPLTEVNPQNNPPEALDLITIDVTQGDFESTGDTTIDTDSTIPVVQFITGGVYSADPTKYVKDGYKAVSVNDKFEVTKIYNITIAQDSTNLITIDSLQKAYKEGVTAQVIEKTGYETIVEVTDTNGNKIKVNDNKFIMPDSDVTIKVTYKEIINPNTGDNIIKYIVLLIVSSIGFGILLKKVLKA